MQQCPSNNYQTRLRHVLEDHLLRLRVYFNPYPANVENMVSS